MRRCSALFAVAAASIAAAAACGAFDTAETPTAGDAGAGQDTGASSSGGGSSGAGVPDATSPDGGGDAGLDAPTCTLEVECLPGATLGTTCFKYSNSGAWPNASGGVLPATKGSEGFQFLVTASTDYGYVTRPLARAATQELNLDLDLSSLGRLVVGGLASGEGEITVEARDTTYVTCISAGGGASQVCSNPTVRPPAPANHRLRWLVKIGGLMVSSTLESACEPPVTTSTNQTTEFSADSGELTINVGINRVLVGSNASVGVDRLRWSYR